MVKEITKYYVLEDIEMQGVLYQLMPPIEYTMRFSERGWSIESLDIKVENCKNLAEAVQSYETLLQERIIAGQIHINMNETGELN